VTMFRQHDRYVLGSFAPNFSPVFGYARFSLATMCAL